MWLHAPSYELKNESWVTWDSIVKDKIVIFTYRLRTWYSLFWSSTFGRGFNFGTKRVETTWEKSFSFLFWSILGKIFLPVFFKFFNQNSRTHFFFSFDLINTSLLLILVTEFGSKFCNFGFDGKWDDWNFSSSSSGIVFKIVVFYNVGLLLLLLLFFMRIDLNMIRCEGM